MEVLKSVIINSVLVSVIKLIFLTSYQLFSIIICHIYYNLLQFSTYTSYKIY